MELRHEALALLARPDPTGKVSGVRALAERARREPIHDRSADIPPPPDLPGRPDRPRLVPPRDVPKRRVGSVAGRAALLHAIAHIEFNAINLALDAIWRFPGLPEAYYRDWLTVAGEEALHHTLLADHLRGLGYAYGDFDAHDGLWAMAQKTCDDLAARMALVPRTLEARGLDATPAIRERLARAGDDHAAAILDLILRDEIGHVAIGNRWYRWACARDGVDPLTHFDILVQRHGAPPLKPPFNLDARRAAGFTEVELRRLATPA
jgi:uncharacterized ferritin-like protein (DUF455 family)